ncbi:MAG: hypothetical protein LBS19_16310 [Clostridiales bacterium]|jgi:hypothetical protein|nr:hypothetical protein [Clostridiales bacterium]
MQTYEFYATPENGFIPIPEKYRDSIKRHVKVIVMDEKITQTVDGKTEGFDRIDLLLPPTLDTRGWKFNREEANER